MEESDKKSSQNPYTSPTDDSSLEKLKKSLEGMGAPVEDKDRFRALRGEKTEARTEWEQKKSKEFTVGKRNRKKYTAIAKLFIGSVAFFALALGVAVFFIVGGVNVVSSDNVEIEITGPVAIEAGEELSLQVVVKNNNAVDLEAVDLLVEYPNSTRDATDLTSELLRQRERLERIPVGRDEERTLKSVLFGEEEEIKEIEVSIEYRVEGSNAILFKKKSYEIVISSSPILLTADALEETIAGQEFETVVNFVSNSTNIVSDAMVVAEYPFGFTFIKADPSPTFGDNVWVLGDVPAAAKRRIAITGVLQGGDGEERTIQFTSGVQSERDERAIGTPLLDTNATIAIRKPFISTTVALNGETTQNVVAQSGRPVRADISWVNNLPTQIIDAVIEVRLNGEILDEQSVESRDGFYQSVDNIIRWDKTQESDLNVLRPGDSGSVSFTFSPKKVSAAQVAAYRDAAITLDVSMSGRRINETGVAEEVVSNTDRIVRVATNLGLSSRAVYSIGPFTNTGGIPPRAEQRTTYTVIWSITNGANDVDGTQVVAQLPSYVEWVGQVSPSTEKVTYNPIGGQVTWDVGTVRAGRGLTSSPREVAFQVSLLPSVTQRGSEPTLVQSATISGRDNFTQTTLSDTSPNLTTRLGTDPIFGQNDGRVQ